MSGWIGGGLPVMPAGTMLGNTGGVPATPTAVPVSALPFVHNTGNESAAGVKTFTSGIKIAAAQALWTGQYSYLVEGSGNQLYYANTAGTTAAVNMTNSINQTTVVSNSNGNLMLQFYGSNYGFLGSTAMGGLYLWSQTAFVPLYSNQNLGNLGQEWAGFNTKQMVVTQWEGNSSINAVTPADGSTVAVNTTYTIINAVNIANLTIDVSAINSVVGSNGMDGVLVSLIFAEGAIVTNLHWPAGIHGAALLPAASTGAYMKIDLRKFATGGLVVDQITK